MRICPECEIELFETLLYGETVDMCRKCGGIFFDKGELESILSIVDIFQNCSLDENDIDTISGFEKNRHFACPVHKKEMVKKEIAGITVDICNECGGIWLDNGEIAALKTAENHIKENIGLYIRLGN